MNRLDCRIFYQCTDKSNYIDSNLSILCTSNYLLGHFNNNAICVKKNNYCINGYKITFPFPQNTLFNMLLLLNNPQSVEGIFNKLIYDKNFIDAVLFLQLESFLPIIIEQLLDLILTHNKLDLIHYVLDSNLNIDMKTNFKARVYYLIKDQPKKNYFGNQHYILDKDRLILCGDSVNLAHRHYFNNEIKNLYFRTNKVDLSKDQLFFSIGCENGEDPDPFIPPSYWCHAKIKITIYDGCKRDMFYIQPKHNERPIRLPGYAPPSSFKFALPRISDTYETKNVYNKHMVYEYTITFLDNSMNDPKL